MNPFFFQLINSFCQRLDYLVTILKIEADLDNTQTMNSLKKNTENDFVLKSSIIKCIL